MATGDEIRIAHEITKAVRRLQLPLKLDEITEGRGNYFPLSVLAQCRRQEVFQNLTSPILESHTTGQSFITEKRNIQIHDKLKTPDNTRVQKKI